MNTTQPTSKCLLLLSLIAVLLPVPVFGLFNPAAQGASPQVAEQDGQHDFDFEIGRVAAIVNLSTPKITSASAELGSNPQ
jgi:hypothetical protein